MRFERREILGRGATGVVYRAFDAELGHDVALKALLGVPGELAQRLKAEFRVLRGLSHPNLVQLYDLVISDDECCFTMELVDGVDIVRFVRDGAASQAVLVDEALARLRTAFEQLALAVEALHGAGKIHRDLKPSNVLVTRDGHVVVLDFGLVASAQGEASARDAGELAGTVPYMAPEQMWGMPPTAAIDWYAIGVILLEALTGVAPFEGLPATILWAKERRPSLRPRALVPATSSALDALVGALLDPDPGSRPGADGIQAALAGGGPVVRAARVRRPADVFVGREREVETLAEWLGGLAPDRPFVAHAVGPSGIGKTALLRRFRERAGSAIVLSSRCNPREIVPYRALDGAVEELADWLRRGAVDVRVPDADALRTLFPALACVAPGAGKGPGEETPSPRELQRRAFAGFRSVIMAIARRQPLVLWIDDAQWGDADSALALIEALRGPDAPRVLLVLSYRADEAGGSALLRELARGELAPDRILELGPLEADQGRVLAAHLLGRDLADPVVDRVVEQASGSPFFIEQLARYLADREGRSEIVDVADAILRRIEAFGAAARDVAEIVAVAGGALDLAHLLALSGTPAAAPLVYRMREQHMLRTVTTRPNSIEVYHDRIRETVLAHIPDGRRRDLHREVADRLRTKENPDPEALLEHLLGAGDEVGAGEAALRAAERAAAALAFGRTAELFALALRLRARGDDDWQLEVRHAEALANAGAGIEAGRAYEAAADGATRCGAPRATVLALRAACARETLCAGDFGEGVRALERMLAAAGLRYPRSPAAAVARLLLARGRIALRGFAFTRRDECEVPAELLAGIDACWAATVGLNAFDVLRSAAFQARHTLMALRAGEPTRVVRALATEGVYRAAEGGRVGRARAAALGARVYALAAETHDPRAIAFSRLCSGVGSYFGADWEGAIERLTEAERVFRTLHGVGWELSNCRNYRIWALAWLGRTEPLAAEVGEAAAEARARGDVWGEMVAASGHGNLVWLLADRPDEARERAAAAIAPFMVRGFQSPHYVDFIAQMSIDLYRGDGWAAWARLCDALPRLRRIGLLRLQLFRIEVLHLMASSALAAAEAPGAPPGRTRWTGSRLRRAATGAIARLRAEDLPLAGALAGFLQAIVLALGGGRSVGARALERAADLVAQHGLALHADAARWYAARLGGVGDERLLEHGIAAPARVAAMLMPGLEGVIADRPLSRPAQRLLPLREEPLVGT